MARVNLTPTRISDYQCEPGKSQSFLWDTSSPCLALRATRNGNKAFCFQSRLHGKDIRITLGSPPAWGVPNARELANRYKVLVDQGIDPREVVAEAKAKSAATALEKSSRKLLAREAWNAYMAAPHPRWGATHRQDCITAALVGGTMPKRGKALTVAAPLASLLAMPLHEITSEAVADWLQRESLTRATSAKNGLRKFRAFINWCLLQPAYKAAAQADCCTASVVRDITPPNKTKPNDCLQKEQLPLWFEHVRKISNPVFSVFYQAILLTGARKGEMRRLKWTDVDLKSQKMDIRDKVEGRRTIPLTPHLATLLEALPRTNAYVFSSRSSKDGHIGSNNKAHTLAVAKAGLPHVSVHGLRRSFSTLSEWIHIPYGVTKQIMGHRPGGVTEFSYKPREISLLRKYHTEIEAFILANA